MTPDTACAVPASLRAAALAMAFGATAHAQTQAQAADATLPEIKARAERERDTGVSTAGAKFDTSARDVPQSITVVDRKMLDSQAATSLAQALRNVPGITLGAGEGGVIGDNINLRGFSARTDVYVDGLRDRGQYARDVFSLDAVEVLKGPASMLFGRGSTGGVINQVSKKPDLRTRGEASMTAGTGDTYRIQADLNQALSDTSAARVAVFGQDARSTRDVVRNGDWGVAPSIRWGIGTPTEITLQALLQRNRDLPDYGFPFVAQTASGGVREPVHAPANRYYGYLDDHFGQSVNAVTATVQHKFGAQAVLRNRTLASDNRTEASPSPLGTVVRGGGGTPSLADPLDSLQAPRQDRDRALRDKSFVNQTDLQLRFATGAVRHTLTTGVELAHEENREDRYVWNTAAADTLVNLGDPSIGRRSGSRALSRTVVTKADTLAAYVDDQLELTRQWKLVAGLRGDRFKASSSLQKYALPSGFPADTTAEAVPKSETMWSPRGGMLFQPDDAQTWYLSYGTSFNPSAETVSQSASTAALDAEKNRSVEAGLKQELLDGELALTAAVFRTEKLNARSRDGAGSVQVTAGRIRVQGWELGATGRVTPQWQIFGGYTYLDGRIVGSPELGTGVDLGVPAQGKAAPNTPRHQATLWTTWRVAPKWELGGGALASSARWLNNYETARIPGFTRFDATLAYLEARYELRLNLQNLSDKLYFESASAGRATPVRGRTALLTATYRF
jgi:catecholate siderophore receptor